MSEPKKVKFQCPNCGSDQLKSIEQADISQVSQKIEIEDGEIYLLNAKTEINADGEYHYLCAKCGKQIGDGTELKKHLIKVSLINCVI